MATNTGGCAETSSKIYLLSGQFTTTVKDSESWVAAVYGAPMGMDFSEEDTFVTQPNPSYKLKIISGQFTSTIKDSQSIQSVEVSPNGISCDNTNTHWSGNNGIKLYLQSGQITSTIKDSQSVSSVDTSPTGISPDGINTAWSGATASKLYLQSGMFTSTIKDSQSVSIQPTGISLTSEDTDFNSFTKFYLQSGQFTSTLKTSISMSGVKWQDIAHSPYSERVKIFTVQIQDAYLLVVSDNVEVDGEEPIMTHVTSILSVSYSWEIKSILHSSYVLMGKRKSYLISSYFLNQDVVSILKSKYDITNITPVNDVFKSVYSMHDVDSEVTENVVTATVNGESIDYHSVSIQHDIDSFCFTFTMTVADAIAYSKCNVHNQAIIITVNSKVFNFIINIGSRNRAFGNTTYTITGYSKTMIMSFPEADPITKNWGVTTAKTVMQELCDDSGITLNFNITDWAIPKDILTFDNVSPISIMELIAKATGAVLQTDENNVLIVQYCFPIPITEYDEATPEIIFSDIDDIVTFNESTEIKKGYDSILVGDEEITEDEDFLYIELDDKRNNNKTTFVCGNNVYFRVYTNIDYEGLISYGSMTLVNQQIEDTVVDDPVIFLDNKPVSVSQFIDEVTSVSWYGNDLGTVSVSGFKSVVASLADDDNIGLCKLTFKTKYDVWKLVYTLDMPTRFKILLKQEASAVE